MTFQETAPSQGIIIIVIIILILILIIFFFLFFLLVILFPSSHGSMISLRPGTVWGVSLNDLFLLAAGSKEGASQINGEELTCLPFHEALLFYRAVSALHTATSSGAGRRLSQKPSRAANFCQTSSWPTLAVLFLGP